MSRGTVAAIVIVLAAGAGTAWIISKRNAPEQVEFIKVTRETIASSLSTNGKVEPIEWMPARAQRSGVISRVLIHKGQLVAKGQPLVELDTRVATADLAKAEAAIRQAKTEQRVVDEGGRLAERQQVDADLARARLDLVAAQKQYQALDRLVAKQAATRVDLDNQRQLVDQLKLRIQALEAHKSALVTGADKEVAKAKLDEAESVAQVARTALDLSVVNSPMDGTVYDFDLKQGAFVNPGDLIANIGKLDRVRVKVFVDEPDLGKVKIGEPVIITWDGMPGHQWRGVVDRLPTQIVPLGTRQVGEVGCVIENPDHDLLPNANITAEIKAEEVSGALVIPKEVVRRQGPEIGVFLLQGDHVEWRKVSLGLSSYTRTQVLSGLNEGDAVALPMEKPLKNRERVDPAFR